MGLGLGAFYGKLLTGERVIRDFVTVGADERLREKVYLAADGRVWDVSGNQWLLGLDPRIIGIWEGKNGGQAEDLGGRISYTLYVHEDAPMRVTTGGETTDGAVPGKVLGAMTLEYSDRVVSDNGILFLFRVKSTVIHHVQPWRAWLLYQKFYRKPGVTYERLKAVAAAYTYPRRVRVISFSSGSGNPYIFPMDLLADIRSAGRYLLGMRHSNQVLKQILEVRRIVVAEAPASYKQLIYQLGRNHSASPPPLDQLSFGVIKTREGGFYLPDWVESYKEIRIAGTLDLGSHMLLCGEWNEEVLLRPATLRLHHIHFLYYLHQKSGRLPYPIIP
jgi:hypothetical protein